MSRELGVLFKPDMHRAIRNRRKRQTRRLVKDLTITGPNKPNGQEMETFAYADGFRKGLGARQPYLREMSCFWVQFKKCSPGKHHAQLIHWNYERRFR